MDACQVPPLAIVAMKYGLGRAYADLEVTVMRSLSLFRTLVLLTSLAGLPSCTVARWTPVGTSPAAFDARRGRTIRAFGLDGARVIFEAATFSGDTLRGTTCAGRDPAGHQDCVSRAVPVTELSALEVRHVNVPLTVIASTATVAAIPLGCFLVLGILYTAGW